MLVHVHTYLLDHAENVTLQVNTVKQRPLSASSNDDNTTTSMNTATEERDVYLYDVNDMTHVSLNHMLVERGLARCAGEGLIDDRDMAQGECVKGEYADVKMADF